MRIVDGYSSNGIVKAMINTIQPIQRHLVLFLWISNCSWIVMTQSRTIYHTNIGIAENSDYGDSCNDYKLYNWHNETSVDESMQM